MSFDLKEKDPKLVSIQNLEFKTERSSQDGERHVFVDITYHVRGVEVEKVDAEGGSLRRIVPVKYRESSVCLPLMNISDSDGIYEKYLMILEDIKEMVYKLEGIDSGEEHYKENVQKRIEEDKIIELASPENNGQ